MINQCEICGNDFMFEWADYHGEGVCVHCGVPYQIIRHDEDGSRIEGAESVIKIKEEYKPYVKRYWEEKHLHMGLGMYFGRPKYPERRQAFADWLDEVFPEKEAG